MKNRHLPSTGSVLDVGSMDMNGSARQFFDGWDYTGIDMMPGKGVDIVMNAHDLEEYFLVENFDVVLCLETLEHDDNFWKTLEGLRNLTKKGGYLIITTPTFGFPIHRHPKDYYRYGEDTYRDVFFKGFEIIDLQEVFSEKGHWPGLVCIGRKP